MLDMKLERKKRNLIGTKNAGSLRRKEVDAMKSE